MSYYLKLLAILCLTGLLTGSSGMAQSTTSDSAPMTVTGRLFIEQSGQNGNLVLHATDGTAYLIESGLTDRLRDIAQKKAGTNLITITGIANGASSLTCERTTAPFATPQGTTALKTEIKCIRYLCFKALAIVSAAESSKPMPPLKRDAAEELKMAARAAPRPPRPPDIGEISGTITACNLRSAINTVTIKNIDKKSPLKSLTVLVTEATRIFKRIRTGEPITLSPEELRTGQHVTVSYAKDELHANAMFITITKE
ncbi:MAG: hypothetical protein WCY10_05515 [Candidatus Omnitrophota bacterium]